MEARRYRCTAAMLEDTIVHLCKRLVCLLWCSVCFSVRYRRGCRAKSLTDGLKECCSNSNPRFSVAHVVPRACACLTTPLGLDCYLRLDISRLVACYQKHVHSSIYVHRTRPRVPCSDVIGGAVPVSVRVIICCGLTTRVTILPFTMDANCLNLIHSTPRSCIQCRVCRFLLNLKITFAFDAGIETLTNAS